MSIDDKIQEIMRREAQLARIAHDQIAPHLRNYSDVTRGLSVLPTHDLLATQAALRSALGPLEELKRLQLGIRPDIFNDVQEVARQVRERFSLPAIDQTRQLFAHFEASGIQSLMRELQQHGAQIKQAMDAMRSPWLDMQNQLRSMGGFAELQRIGLSLQNMPSFDIALADRLRAKLGDWRDAVNWPADIFTDVAARTAFYEAKGLDFRLTDFPPEAFEQGVFLAGLSIEPPAYLARFDARVSHGEQEEEEGFERTNEAHDRLLRFETHLRRFIEERMRAAFGDNWIKHNVPSDIRERWVVKKAKAVAAGNDEWPLIAYADFTDYVPIITQKDNWKAAFAPVFRRAEFVRESFQRLYPIRLCTMHARIITQDDELYLFVETKRVLSAINETKE